MEPWALVTHHWSCPAYEHPSACSRPEGFTPQKWACAGTSWLWADMLPADLGPQTPVSVTGHRSGHDLRCGKAEASR